MKARVISRPQEKLFYCGNLGFLTVEQVVDRVFDPVSLSFNWDRVIYRGHFNAFYDSEVCGLLEQRLEQEVEYRRLKAKEAQVAKWRKNKKLAAQRLRRG